VNRRLALILALAGLLVMPGSAFAASATVSLSGSQNKFFDASPTIDFGDFVDWQTSATTRAHTATSTTLNDNPFDIDLPAGSATSTGVNFARAGAFGYRCDIHHSMTGTISVRMMSSDTTPNVSQLITITFATSGAPSGFTEVIQKRKAGGTWRLYQKSTGTSVNWTPGAAKTFEFRARLKRLSDGAVSGWSPTLSLTVAP
jgi:plastocyanin